MFTNSDKEQIRLKGISEEQLRMQLNRFENRVPPLKISSTASIGNGIMPLTEEDITFFIELYDHAVIDVLKFVPASGASSRMFKSLFQFLSDSTNPISSVDLEEKDLALFFNHIADFAFYEDWNASYLKATGSSIPAALAKFQHHAILDFLLSSTEMGYGNLPKGLLPFHRYGSSIRTAIQEQLYEGLHYACKKGKFNSHFTVSPNHLEKFQTHIASTLENFEKADILQVSFSCQKPSTDTLAATLDFKPFRTGDGKLLFRPAGHGTLLENLNELEADLVFIKNIDNIAYDHLKSDTTKFKKTLAGILLSYQKKAFALLRKNDVGENVLEEAQILLKKMGIEGNFSKKEIFELLNRPIRVCGMVKNEGEPGGGPFWVKNGATNSLQIVEFSQLDTKDSEQTAIFRNGTYFNPVDLVCGIKNYKGKKFDLLKYRDENAGFISEKSYNGKKLLSMELPGLWNGGMAYWNTLFVEVPITTFNPIKTVIDLLKPAHHPLK